tara:strand:+ start:80 stop:475 length:396 start_codon:yes stop_codon:yes gene_type:complete
MAAELTATAAGSAAVTVLGAWELRAGSQDTTEWLDGAADVSYPGGGTGTFRAENSDGANGYDPAPKMALLEVTTASNTAAVTLAGGISSVLMVMSSQQDGTAAANKVAFSGLVVTVTGATAQKHNVLVMYN